MKEVSYEQMLNESLFVGDIEVDYWLSKRFVPLGTRKPFEYYADGIIPDHEIVGWKIDKTNPVNILILEPTGSGKTRKVKNIAKAYWKHQTKIMFINPKGSATANGKRKGNGRRIHHKDRNESLPMKCFVPSYVFDIPDQNNKYIRYHHKIEKLLDVRVWMTLGMSEGASVEMKKILIGGKTKMEEIIKEVRRQQTYKMINFATAESIMRVLERAKALNFFDTESKVFDLEKEWDNNNVVSIHYFDDVGSFMSTDIGIMIEQAVAYCKKKRSQGEVPSILLIFDDASLYLKSQDSIAKYNLAVIGVRNCQHNYREYGVNSVTIIQLPELIDKEFCDGAPIKLVGALENADSIRGKVREKTYEIVKADPRMGGLYRNPETYTFEGIVQKDMSVERYFPFDCTIGH